ncbi:hypothetical protein U0070_015739 [Myodes glareolus]|uniref:PH domain-containing protein n=1 Tax=Myodes glareolus TaxID=447135 RepID=A0AAW0I6M8_MYOGA
MHDNYLLYVFAPDCESRQRWVLTLKEETRNNNSLVSKYHPNFWMDGRWRCCTQLEKLAVGCAPYDPTKNGKTLGKRQERTIPAFYQWGFREQRRNSLFPEFSLGHLYLPSLPCLSMS